MTDRVAELVERAGTPMPGALDAVATCRRLGLPIAVCSGSFASVIEAALARLGIADEVAVWHSAEWEPLGKPHPAVYLTTAAELGIDARSCLAVEDSFNGALAAKAARMRVAVVPEPATLDSPRWGFCDRLLRSLEEFDGALLDSFGAAPPRDGTPRDPWKIQLRKPVRDADTPSARGIPWAGGPSDVRPAPVAGRSGYVARTSRASRSDGGAPR